MTIILSYSSRGERQKHIGPCVKKREVSAMGDNTNPDDLSPLLPDRYPQQDFFVCDVFDAAPKGDMASMEHPLFSISTKPELTAREYRNGSTFVRVSPGELGRATVRVRDVLVYCIIQLLGALNHDTKYLASGMIVIGRVDSGGRVRNK